MAMGSQNEEEKKNETKTDALFLSIICGFDEAGEALTHTQIHNNQNDFLYFYRTSCCDWW